MNKKFTMVATICGLCIVSAAIGAFAHGMVQDISAQLRPDFTVVIDGQARTFKDADGNVVYPLLHDGTTYLPVRAIGELMGKKVYWYEADKRIELKDPATTVTDADVIVPDAAPTIVPTPDTVADSGAGAPADKTATNGTQTGVRITEAEAKAAALKRAGLDESQVKFDRTELDMEHGRLVYEIEFRQGRTEYTADVSAEDGSIISWETDND